MRKISVSIVGTVGIPANYGGFETLVENLVINQPDFIDYTVFASSGNYKIKPEKYLKANMKYVSFNANGVQSIIYDVISLLIAAKNSDVILLLGVSGAVFLPVYKFLFPRIKIVTNIDGIEWRRDKWNIFVKWFLKISEKYAVQKSDYIITDNKGIHDYVYRMYGVSSITIAYGAHELNESIELKQYKELKIKTNQYAFKVSRIEPENNIVMILDAFIGSTLDIVFVGNWSNSLFGKSVFKKYSNYANIHLLDPIYDIQSLNELRSNCQFYVHGHSAGGTNPSLVEAMALSLPVISFDVDFNRYTLDNNGIFFKSAIELRSILKNIATYDLKNIGLDNFNCFEKNYTWNKIAKQYTDIFTNAREDFK